MIVNWMTGENILILAEALFWLCVILLTPVFYKIAYYASAPIWARLFPAKEIELQYTIDGKVYTATVSVDTNLSEASSKLRAVATQKHEERYG